MNLLSIFPNTNVLQFKKKFIKTFNCIVNYSFGHSVSFVDSISTINAGYVELITLAKQIKHPYEIYFNIHLPYIKISISVCEAILIITNVLELATSGHVIDKLKIKAIILAAKQDIKSDQGKLFIKEILYNN